LRKTLTRDGKDTAKEKADDEGKTPTTARRRRRRRRTEDSNNKEEEEKKEEQKRFRKRRRFKSSRGKDVHVIIIVLVRVVKNINFSALFVNLNFVFRVSSRDIFRERDFINHPPFLDVREDVSLVILM